MEDIERIKSMPTLASNSSTTFLSLSASAVTDLATIPNPVSPVFAQSVSSYIGDSDDPMLLSFVFDINEDRLLLTFNEPVSKSSAQFTSISIYSTNSSLDLTDFSITLSNGTFSDSSQEHASEVVIHLSREDIERIKANTSIGTEVDNTYIEILDSAFLDRAGNSLDPVERLQAASVVVDVTRPELTSFIFDARFSELILTFSDVVDVSTFDATAFRIQDNTYASVFYDLSNDSTTSTDG